ncbi:site-2 protease family protein [Bacillus tianshenii]|nr:site-2 protease family protein [Bacillus tianshenii]
MDQFLAFPVDMIPYLVVTLIIAFSIHEFAHAYIAYLFGDPTAKEQGRLTLSPLAHLDVFGTLMIFLLGFGWAKPVPVNRSYFKRPRLSGILVSVAGPLSNFMLMCLAFLVWYLLMSWGIEARVERETFEVIYRFVNTFILLNLILGIFNLLPFPPLDGYRIVEDLVSPAWRVKLRQLENYGIVIFLLIVLTPLDQYTITPIFDTLIPFVFSAVDHVFSRWFLG